MKRKYWIWIALGIIGASGLTYAVAVAGPGILLVVLAIGAYCVGAYCARGYQIERHEVKEAERRRESFK